MNLKSNLTISEKIKNSLVTLPVIASILIMFINDHFLKGSGILPGWLTGKISDFTFLFFGPILASYLFRVNTKKSLVGTYSFVSIFYSALDFFPEFSDFLVWLVSRTGLKIGLWPDITDLLALPVLFLSWKYIAKIKNKNKLKYKSLEKVMVIMASITCMSTTIQEDWMFNVPPMTQPVAYNPVYLSWDEFRNSLEILPPQNPQKTGQIMTHGSTFFLNEPNKGIHVYDNSDNTHPVPVSFIKIWGNLNMHMKDNYLYADSFVDLVILNVGDIYNITVVNRMNDVFAYNACQVSPSGGCYYTSIDSTKGVIIDWN